MNLHPFCSTDPIRHNVSAPFTHGAWTFATDLRILIRVPSTLVMAATPPNVPGLKHIEAIFPPEPGAVQLAPLPIFQLPPPEYEPCKECDGHGHFKKCHECAGEGTIECESCGHGEKCLDCKGEGWIATTEAGASPCDICNGAGKAVKVVPLDVNGANFNPKYIELLLTLPGLLFQKTCYSGEPAYFTFAHGDGVVMPFR